MCGFATLDSCAPGMIRAGMPSLKENGSDPAGPSDCGSSGEGSVPAELARIDRKLRADTAELLVLLGKLDREGDRMEGELTDLRWRMAAAMEVVTRFGGIDGDHHKAWVIDQVVRALKGDDYAEWVREMCAGDDGPNTYDWDVGIPP